MPTGRLHRLRGKHMVHGGWGMVSARGERLHSCQTSQRYCKQIAVGVLALSLRDIRAQWCIGPSVLERLRRYRNTYEVRSLVQDLRTPL
jgi:hypothetical protein